MRKNNGVLTIGIIGVILIAFSAAAFFLLDIERITLHWWALAFLLLAEFVLCAGIIGTRFTGANHSKVFGRSGITVVLSFYLIATIISLLFIRQFDENVNAFIILELGIIALTAIASVSILSFARRIANSDQQTFMERGFMDGCERRIGNLLSDPNNKAYSNNLNKLHENFKYSDKVGASSLDGKIGTRITELENALSDKNEKEIISAIDEISAFLSQRNAEIKESKRGGF